MKSATNRDIWFEILRYFRISFEDDTEDDIHLKRRVLSSVALLCPELAGVALDELWRSMTTLEPIVQVFNAIPDSLKPNFHFNEDDVGDVHWDVTLSPTELRSQLPRIRSYLNRIHTMHFATFPNSKKYALWQVVQSLGGVYSLCPNLKRLFLDLENGSTNLIHHLYLLRSPSIKSVTFVATPTPFADVAACMLLNMFRCHNTELLEISYLTGYSSPRLFRCITQFTSLRSLVLAPRISNSDSRLNDIQIASLQQLTHLRTLVIDLDMVLAKVEKATGYHVAKLEELTKLELHGRPSEIQHFLPNNIVFHSLLSLSVFLMPGSSQLERNLFSMIPSSFPKLRSLSIDGSDQSYQWTMPTTFADLISGRGGQYMTHMNLLGIPCNFLPQDIVSILTTWPTLKQLSIVPAEDSANVCFDAGDHLPWISTHATRLESLFLHFDLGPLALAAPTTYPSPKCPLQTLKLFKPKHVPKDLKMKRILVQRLITLFPRLAVFEAVDLDGNVRGHFRDIQLLIDCFRDIISSPPSRPDCLFY